MICLIIDDDADDQEIFIMVIQKVNTNIQCFTFDTGVEALQVLSTREFIPDYIFLDVNMPKMNGIDCLKEIKQFPHLNNTKVYMYSTTSEGSTSNEASKLGATGFIIKPASPAILQKTLSAIFTRDPLDN